jgi:hypothetical protein
MRLLNAIGIAEAICRYFKSKNVGESFQIYFSGPMGSLLVKKL